MKKIFAILSFIAVLLSNSCKREAFTPETSRPESPETVFEDVFLSAVVENPDAKVDFEYTDGMYTKWHGDEIMHVYIKHADGSYEQPEAGVIEAVPGTLSADGYALNFAGSVRARQNPETDSFAFIYADMGITTTSSGVQKLVYNYDFTKQSINGSDHGLQDLHRYFPIIFESDEDGNIVASKKACIIKIKAGGLPADVKVTSIDIYAGGSGEGESFQYNKVFPKVVDVADFEYMADNKSHTLSYAFEDTRTDSNGEVELYLAAPIIAGEKNYEISIVYEEDGEFVTKKAASGISSASALSVSKLYKLTRNEWAGSVNPGTVVGNPDDKVESIVGQWDKTGFLSNDIYGVLDLGKPEKLSYIHNAIINALQKAYTHTSGDNDIYVHPAAVKAAGKQGYNEKTSLTMDTDGPQYVRVSGEYTSAEELTFNNIILREDTELYMTFVDSKAYNTNTIGYYCYPTAEEDTYKTRDGHGKIHEMVVFPSTSQDLRDPTVIHKFESKTTAQMLYPQFNAEGQLTGAMKKNFAAGTSVGLFGYTNGLDNSKDFALLPLTSTSNCKGAHYTNIAWNRRNWFDPDENTRPFWNQICVLRVIMPGEDTPRTDCVIVTMKDEYDWHGHNNQARTWTNPILLVYATNPNAIDFTSGGRDSKWATAVDLNDIHFSITYDLDAVTSTNKSTSFDGSYSTTLAVANPEFGDFNTLKVTAGGVDITNAVVSGNTGKQAEITISRELAAGDITITATAAKNIMAQSLTAAELMELAAQTGENPEYRLILHSCASGAGSEVVYGFNGPYTSVARKVSDVPSVLYNYDPATHIISTPTQVKVADEYNNFEWTLERADGGFKLKKLDTGLNLEGYLTRSSATYGGYPLARLEMPTEQNPHAGSILTAVSYGSNGYEMKLKTGDGNLNFLTCAFGWQCNTSIFNNDGSHVNQYGIWRVYKVWLADK